MGIGGEYAAINSAIDGLIPSRYRGRVDIAVNGTYWGGALLATLVTLLVINNMPVSYSWRIAFLAGPALGFLIIFIRRNLPESPRWLLMQGRVDEAEAPLAPRQPAPLPAVDPGRMCGPPLKSAASIAWTSHRAHRPGRRHL
jgi:MFS family permease